MPALLAARNEHESVKTSRWSDRTGCDLKLTRDGSGRRARRLAREQRGERNTSRPRSDGELTQVEVVDPETGSTRIEYRRDGQTIGVDDPEAQMSVMR